MKKVLIITYYWPPSGGSGVQRWLKFVKYLRDFGWESIVYTPENPEMPVLDPSLEKDIPDNLTVLKTPIWEPYSIYKKLIGKKKEEKINVGFLSESKKPKLSEKLSVWIRGNFFIPDARVFWVKPSVKFLSGYLSSNKIDVVISTGPPHSMHLIAKALKEKFNLPWIADFRDPWTNIDFYQDLMLTNFADQKHRRLELDVLKGADLILTIGETMKEEFLTMGDFTVKVLTNGYDEDDLVQGKEIQMDSKFSLAHIGSLVKTRNPTILWQALSEMILENELFATDLEIKLVGKVDFSVLESITAYHLEKYCRKIDYLPHSEVVVEQQKSQVLLLLLNNTPNAKGVLTGKVFEYLASKRPIICVGPENGDVAKILNETKAGDVVDFDDLGKMKEILNKLYIEFKKSALKINSEKIALYSRRELTASLKEILERVSVLSD